MRSLSSTAFALGVGAAASIAAAAPLSEEDPRGAAQLREEHPHALQLAAQGDAELSAGHFENALSLLDRAEEEAPATPLIERKRCLALSGLGRRDEALSACDMAISIGGQLALDRRAKVTALMAGSAAPLPADAAEAYWIARRVSDAQPNGPWGYAAFCEIAERIGDSEMWRENLRQLQHVAPDHFETKHALQRADALHDTWRRKLLAWCLLLSVAVVSATHRLLRQRRSAVSLTAQAASRAHEP